MADSFNPSQVSLLLQLALMSHITSDHGSLHTAYILSIFQQKHKHGRLQITHLIVLGTLKKVLVFKELKIYNV